ncbi:MAG TPA: tripartite tricarboxylate transporter substrate binding protein [Spirochaetia bacterium]|nr:tripartite tricarboxylate transporter substrate binding protein [Spirochaetia bacterium]
MKKILIVLLVLLMAAGMAAFANGAKEGTAAAQPSQSSDVAWPTKAIQVVVPAGAGGDTDLNSRILGKYLTKELGQPVVIVNVGGAGGTLGSRKVKDAAPDGNTVLFFHNGFLLNKLLGLANYGLESFKVSAIAVMDNNNAFVTSGTSKYNSMKDVVAALKAKPMSVSFATEVGSFTHLQVLSFEKAAGVKMNIVDVGGAAAKTAALLGDQIDLIGTQLGLVRDYLKKGDFRGLAVASAERSPAFPNVPTFKEQGYDVEFSKFYFYAFPKDTPDAIVNKFSAAVEKVVNDPAYQKEIDAALNATPTYMGPAKATAYIQNVDNEYNSFKDVILSAQKK